MQSGLAQSLNKNIDKSQVYIKSDDFVTKILSPFLRQAKSHGRICSLGGRGLPRIALSPDRDSETSRRSKETFTTWEQSRRARKEPVAFSRGIRRAVPGAERFGAA